ncbi:MAG: hypothetical protein KF716_32715 [Anaerolineae bacterium]|nr:hypothetical protein [Anaerolineae bacterium]
MDAAPSTTLVAIRLDTNERLSSNDLPPDVLRALSEARLLRCPHCQGLLTFKAGTVRVHHFAHLNLTACASADHEPETDAHRQGKLRLFQQFRVGASFAALEQHLPITDQRADAFVQFDTQRYALEFQQANNTAEHWLERHHLYRQQNIADVWFLGKIRYQEHTSTAAISSFDPLPVPRDVFGAVSGAFRMREMEKAMLSLNPQLRYLDPDTGEVTLLLMRDLHGNTLRAYRYQFPLTACELRLGDLYTPLEPLLDDFYAYHNRRKER